MKLGIQLYVAGLSLLIPISDLDSLGGQHSRKAFYGWVLRADLQPDDGEAPNQVALNESVIRINDQQFWLYAAIDPATNKLLHIRFFATYTTPLSEIFLGEIREKYDVDDAMFFVNNADWFKTALQRHCLDFRYDLHRNRNSAERVFRELKRRPSSFSNCFSHVETETAET